MRPSGSIKIPDQRVKKVAIEAGSSVSRRLGFMKNIGYAGLSIVLSLAFAAPGMSQQPSAAETACNGKYTKYYGAQKDMQLFNDFVNDATCKDSMYREGAFQLMAQGLIQAMNWKGAMDLSDRMFKDFPTASANGKHFVYSQGLTGASQVGDADKMIDHGERVLSVKADDLNAMLIVAVTIPDKLSTDAAAKDKDKLMDRAVELAKKLLAAMKPGPVDDKTWNLQVQGPAHGVIGFVHLQREKFKEAEDEYDQAVKINPKDQMSWYRYGLAATKITIAAQKLIQPAYDKLNNNRTPGPERDAAIAEKDAIDKDFVEKRTKAIEIFVSAVALPDPAIAKAAKTSLDSLWMAANNNTLNGLDDAITARKAELSK
jgi:tetratricopeptide (TPR) repeat protein